MWFSRDVWKRRIKIAGTMKYEEAITMGELYFVVGGREGGGAKNRNVSRKHNLRCKDIK